MKTTTTLKLGMTVLFGLGLAACASPSTTIPNTAVSNTEVATTTLDNTSTPAVAATDDMTATAMMASTAMPADTAMPASTEMPATTTSGTAVSNTPLTSLTIATDTTVGAYLADGNGRPLYIFTKDTGTTSTCDAACQQEWTPVVVTGIPTLMTGVSTGLVGTTMTASGATQLTIGGHPVYYHVGDTMSGELTGQGMDNAWFLISPTGSAAR